MTTESLQVDVLESSTKHARVLGGPGSGKTSLAVQRFRQLRSSGRKPTLVAYTRAHQKRLIERLVDRDGGRFGRASVTTFSQLASRALELSNRRRRAPLRDIDELVVISHAIDALDGGLQSDYRRIAGSDAFRRATLGVVHVMLQHDIDSDTARRAAESARTQRCADLLRVYARFRDILEAHHLVTFYDIAWRAAELLDGGSAHPLAETDVLLVDDAQDVDPGQARLIEAIAPPESDIVVNLFGDPTGARFSFRGTSVEFLAVRFPAAYRPAEFELESYRTQDTRLDRVVASLCETLAGAGPPNPRSTGGIEDLPLFSGTGSSTTAVEGSGGGRVLVDARAAEDPVAEAQAAAREVLALVASGTDPGDIAIVARDRRPYESIVSLAFADAGIDVDTGASGAHAPDSFVRALLGALAAAPDERTIETITASPLFRPLRDAMADKLGLGDWIPVRAAADLARITGYFGRRLQEGKRDDRAVSRVLEEAIRPAIEKMGVTLEGAPFDSVMSLSAEWARYRETVSALGARASIGEFLRFYASRRSNGRRDRRKVGFYTARETTGESFPVVFLLGCADGVFPRIERDETYVPYREIESCLPGVRFHETRSRDARVRDERRLALTALTRARERLHVSFPSRVRNEASPAPADVFVDLFAECGDTIPRRAGIHLRAARAVARGRVLASPEDAPASASGIESLWLSMRPEAPRFAIQRFGMSPSRLETFARCERKLFYTRVLGIEEESTIPATIGKLFHDVMERIGRECPSREAWLALTDDRVEGHADAAIRSVREFGPPGSLIEQITRHNLIEMVRSARGLERDREPGYRTVDVERGEPFEYRGQQFVGRIDRIDEVNGLFTVIDYKTGKVHKTGKTILRYARGESQGNRHWQLPFYCRSIKEQEGAYPELFCYYVLQPNEDPFVVGLFVRTDPGRREGAPRFHASYQKKFDNISPEEITLLMDEAAEITENVFAERTGFPRTQDIEHCRNCYFNRVCERRTHEPQF